MENTMNRKKNDMPAWDDEAPDWGAIEEEVNNAPAPEAAPAAEGGEKKEGEAGAEGAAPVAEGEEPADPDAVDERKFFKHWVRPKFLQYSYMYDYRKNYYDDVIDYLDQRSHGIVRELPRPQTWAERVLRTYNQKASAAAIKSKTDDQLIHSLHHTRALNVHRTNTYYHRAFTIAY